MTSTDRIYASAQAAFQEWCASQGFGATLRYDDIGRYLTHCLKARGPSATRVHLSAIADLFRRQGSTLDTKHLAIQDVMMTARRRNRSANRTNAELGATMRPVSDDILDAAMAAYGQTKSMRADRARLRRAIAAAVTAAYSEGYRKGLEAGEYNDSGDLEMHRS